MDNRRLESLIRMASEIEELERSAFREPVVRLVHDAGSSRRPALRRTVLRVGTFMAAAACVGLAVMLSRQPSPDPTRPTPVAVKPIGPTPAPRPPLKLVSTPSITPEYARKLIETLEGMNDVASGVLAIYEDSGGIVRCVRWHPYDFGGRDLEDLTPGEVVKVSYGRPHCAVVGPHRLIAVAVRGPVKNLPTSDERAQALAECIVGEPPTKCEAQAMLVDPDSPGCFPNGLEVMVETLAMGRN
jgi:hypothetical protein